MSILSTIEADAAKVLSWINKTKTTLNATPAAIAGLGVILSAFATAISAGVSAAASGGVNIVLDEAAFQDVKTAWSDIQSFASGLGIKL